MNSQKVRFLYFWNIGQIPFGIYKHVVKFRMQENIFCVKKSM